MMLGVILLVGSQPSKSGAFLLLVAGVRRHAGSYSAPRGRGLHQLLVGTIAILVQEDVQSLLVDSSFGKLNLKICEVRILFSFDV
jgi:hypothetical protein